MGKYERKRPPVSPRRRWEVDIRMELKSLCRVRLGLTWSGHEQVTAACEHGNEPSDSIKCEEFLDWLRNC